MARTAIVAAMAVAALACGIGAEPTLTPTPSPSPTDTPAASEPSARGAPLLPSVSHIIASVKPSVVSIATTSQVERCGPFFGCVIVQENSAGTGVIFHTDGLIVTNDHVIANAVSITVNLVDERTFMAEVVGRDPLSDLAVVRIPGGGYPAAEFAAPDELREGDWVIAIGNALALVGGPTVTLGIVGALDRSITTDAGRLYDVIQTDAGVNPGNSGGPLVDLNGRVVGINSARAQGGEGIGFAVSAFTVVPVVESIVEHGRVVFGWIGVGARDVTPVIAAQEGLPVSRGAMVSSLRRGGPAARAGMRNGDIIVAVDGAEVDSVKQLQREMRRYAIGHEAEVRVVRGSDTLAFRVRLEEQPRSP